MFEHNIYSNKQERLRFGAGGDFLATPLTAVVGSNGVRYAYTATNNPS